MSAEKETVQTILDRHRESRKWMKENYYGELTEVYRSLKMRTKPILKKDAAGKDTSEEDKSQTNVCMPGPNIAWRRGVARLTANPYRIKYTGDVDPVVLEMLSALAIQQYDRSGEAKEDRRIVMSGKAFGFAYSELYWDTLDRSTTFRRALVKGNQLVYRDRASVMRWQGAPEDEVQQATEEKGPQLSDPEVSQFLGRSGYEVDGSDDAMSQFMASNGPIVQIPQQTSKYEGPVLKNVFIGDLDLAPGCLSLDDSDYVIKYSQLTDLDLKKLADTTVYLADDGQTEIPAFDKQAVQELIAKEPDKQIRLDDLKEWFLSVTGTQGQDQYQFPKRLRVRKIFDVLAQHALGDDGRMWVTWVSPNLTDKQLGKMPYPWDLGGKTTFSEFIPLENMLDAYGDSTVRLMRFLHAMHNRTVAQNFDYITNILKRFVLKQQNLEMSDEIVTRGNWRELEVADINKIKVLDEPGIPPGAFEREGQILRMMSLLEPALNTTDTGTASNPMAGKLATTALINAKAFDSLTQFELDGRDLYLKDIAQKKLAMNRDAAQEKWVIQQKFWGEELRKRVQGLPPATPETPLPEWALSSRFGKTAAVRLDPLEIQEDLGVEPEAMSYLSVDDELRKAAANELDQVALAAPDVLDRRKVIRFHLTTIRNIGNPDDYILPEQAGPTPPPFKGSIGVNMPLDKMPADVVNQVLPMFGLQPSQELAHRDTLDAVGRLNEAGKDATELTSHAEAQMPQVNKPNGKPPAK